MAEARARIDLRSLVTRQDAEDVVELMQYTMRDCFLSEREMGLMKRGSQGGKAQDIRLITELHRISQAECRKRFSVSELRCIANEIGLRVPSIQDLIDKLNDQGALLKKGNDEYAIS